MVEERFQQLAREQIDSMRKLFQKEQKGEQQLQQQLEQKQRQIKEEQEQKDQEKQQYKLSSGERSR